MVHYIYIPVCPNCGAKEAINYLANTTFDVTTWDSHGIPDGIEVIWTDDINAKFLCTKCSFKFIKNPKVELVKEER